MAKQLTKRLYFENDKPKWLVYHTYIRIKPIKNDCYLIQKVDEDQKDKKDVGCFKKEPYYNTQIKRAFYDVLEHEKFSVILSPRKNQKEHTATATDDLNEEIQEEIIKPVLNVNPYNCSSRDLVKWLRFKAIDCLVAGVAPKGMTQMFDKAMDFAKEMEKDALPSPDNNGEIDIAKELKKIVNDETITYAGKLSALKELDKRASGSKKREIRPRVKLDISEELEEEKI